MNNISTIIKKIRKENNLTQKQLADILGVTYQAVSKWENNKSVPDISILKNISNIYNIEINELLGTSSQNKKNYKLYGIIVIAIIIVIIITFLVIDKHKINFKTLSTTCNNFKITGSIAYNKDYTSMYISNIDYCGEEDLNVYKEIKCNLYEEYQNEKVIVSECETKDNIQLNSYLTNLTFNVNNYKSICKSINKSNLYLEINATNNDNKIIIYKIPITLNENCH